MTTTVAELSVKVSADLAPLLLALKKAQAELGAFDKAALSSFKKINSTIGSINPKVNTNNARMQLSTLEFYAQKSASKINSALNIKPNIKVTPIGGSGSFINATRSVSNLQSSVSRLALAIGTYLSIHELQQYADAWTEAGNKIRAASEIAGVEARSLEEVNKIATKTRSSIEETADLYSKLIRTASAVAKSETEIAIATEVVNKAFKAGGSSLQEQKNGIIQLGQALGSGILQGDELRSIRENAPVLAQAIAREFNTTVAGLKKLGADGKLTSDKIFRAIVNAQTQVEAAFARTTPTIEEQFSILKNGLIEYVGETSKAIGVTKAISNIMAALTNNISSVANAAAAAAAVLLGLIAVPAIVGAIANPFVWVAAAIGGVVFAVSELWDKIVPLQGSFASLGDYMTVYFNQVKSNLLSIKEAVISAFSWIIDAMSTSISGIGEVFSGINDVIYSFINTAIDDLVKLKDMAAITFEALPSAIASGIVEAMNFMIKTVNAGIDAVVNKVNTAIMGINSLIEWAGGNGIGTIAPYQIGEIENQYKTAGEKAAKAFLDVKNKPAQDWIGSANSAVDDAVNSIVQKANLVHRERISNIKDESNSGNASAAFGGSTDGFGGGVSNVSGGGGGKKKKQSDFEKEIQQIKERTATLLAENAAQAGLNPLVDDYGYAVEFAKAKQELLNAAEREHLRLTPEITSNIDALAAAYANAHVESEKLTSQQELLKNSFEDFRQTSRDVLQGFVKDLIKGKSASEALSNALGKIADKLMDKAFDMLFNSKAAGGSGIFDSLFSWIGSLFADGGYTGDGGKYEPAGVVHKGEYVLDQKTTRRLGVHNLDKISRGYATGGYVSGVSVSNAYMGSGSMAAGVAKSQLEIHLKTDNAAIAGIADTRIKAASPSLIGVAVNESQKRTKANMPEYISNAQTRRM